jgi:hypothetical protein
VPEQFGLTACSGLGEDSLEVEAAGFVSVDYEADISQMGDALSFATG